VCCTIKTVGSHLKVGTIIEYIEIILIPEPTPRRSRGGGTNSIGKHYIAKFMFINNRGRMNMVHMGGPHWSQKYSCISKISIFKNIYLENHVSHNELWSKFCLKKWEELIYYGKSWNIGQVCFECLMFMNFVALISCIKNDLFPFQWTCKFPLLSLPPPFKKKGKM
jgi:hypothetical protein